MTTRNPGMKRSYCGMRTSSVERVNISLPQAMGFRLAVALVGVQSLHLLVRRVDIVGVGDVKVRRWVSNGAYPGLHQ